ncbi:hypotheical conserved protein [Halarchaeum acidiphilum MH1-52-1]|uniref:Hypotheical conserved protein n=1 Tax=Halarchaeum acidiphilum MH1-52-1 TaxID=1261545 RepID=U3AGM4_9EURY|nr:hypotheical conserved protein [Halarchaeum acidiphilum MH1-52-1]
MSAVEGSKDAILEEMASHEKVYFCTSVFKDAAQHRSRLKRMAENVQRDFDEVTDDGTLVYGKTYTSPSHFADLGAPTSSTPRRRTTSRSRGGSSRR